MPVSGIEFTSINRITDSATARTWASGLKTQFLAAGLGPVHPSDTGQTLASSVIYSGSVITSESVGGTRGTGTFSPLTSDAGLGGTGIAWTSATGLNVPYTTAAGRAIINSAGTTPLSYYLDSGVADHRIDATIYLSGNSSYNAGLYCRFIDNLNYVFAHVNGNGLITYGYVLAGSTTSQQTASAYFSTGDQLSIQVTATSATFYKNGTQFGTSSIPGGLAAGTKVGFIGGNIGATGVDEIAVSGALGSTLNMGYEMFKLPGSTTPGPELYLKAEYMGNASNTSYPKLRLSVGRWVSNGTLSIHPTTTIAPTTVDVWLNSAADSSARSCWIAADSSGFVFVHGWDSSVTSVRAIYAFDRHRDTSGDGTTDGYSVMSNQGSTKTIFNYDPRGVERASSVWPTLTPGNVSTLVSSRNAAGETNLFQTVQTNAIGSANSKMLVGYNNIDVPGNTIFTATHLGATRTYRALSAFSGLSMASESGISAAIWWGD